MISIIRLIDGTEIVGSIVSQTKEHCEVKDPLQINYRQQGADSLPAVYMHRYVPFACANTYTFKQEHVINILTPLSNLEKYYNAVLKSIKNGLDDAMNKELAQAATDDEQSNDELVKLAMMEKKAFKATIN